MPRANPLQAAFNAGELGPRLAARVDFAKYRNAGSRVENMLPLPQGGLTRRPGTRFVAAAADPERRPRLLPFEFSTEQAYVLEAGHGRFRFFRNKGQIVVQPTDAAIANGGFDSDIAGWDDVSSGAAAADHRLVGGEEVNLLQFAQTAAQNWGDGIANRAHLGFKFPVENTGELKQALIQITAVAGAFSAVARIHADSGGNPGSQVGGDSEPVAIDAAQLVTFAWTTQPTLLGGSTYWIVFSDVTLDGSGNANVSQCADRGAAYASGFHDNVASLADTSGGFTSTRDLRVKIQIENEVSDGALALVGAASAVAAAEQAVATGFAGQEHVLAFRVIGAPGDRVKLRIGRTAAGDQFLTDTEVETGTHAVAFTPDASPFYLQFRNDANKEVYVDDVRLIGSGAPGPAALELATPYGEDDLAALKWAQSADVMYITHPDHPPGKLGRRGNTTWSLTQVAFEDGPYLDENGEGGVTLKPSATTGIGITITASGHAPFREGDVGRPVRLRPTGEPGWAVITEIVSPEQVRADVKRAFANVNATANWRLGAWSAERGYPGVVTFFEQRTAWANTRSQPQSFWMSQSADLENMRPDSFAGGAVEVQDDDGLDFTIAADQVNAIRWMSPGRQLILGTSGGEWSVTSDGPVVTPLDVEVKRESTNGSADILPLRIGSIVLFVQRARRKLREFVFSLETDGFHTPDLTILADHVTAGGLREIVYQQEPDSQVHCLREDGVLATLTYRREQDVVGWSRHVLGGRFGDGAPVIESLAAIPGSAAAASENHDEAWLAVKRTVDGATFRSIEVFEAPFEGPNPETFDAVADFDAAVLARQKDAFYVDCGLSYAGPPTETLSGLDHLEGETVTVLADGALHPDRIVAGGAIALQAPASVAHVGLPYRHVFASLKLEAGAAAGTAVGKVKRVHGIALVLLHSLGLRIGPSVARLQDVPLREVGDAMDQAVPLFTGELFASFDGDFERDARIVVSGSAPLPLTLLAAAPELKTNELL
ncbi:MAG: choice-of-anchor R domain-containing protein [Kiloniellaceae bacterium]